ncbi:uncharacterized protein A4U43_C01F7360 [Asparagus officinalis]|uniref:Uncharacterized protein n=1 Tax=Asparagus officinalis TaxID=4686 RepID=A0A5P1FQ44_ASPOF|nr:uncharacterized protein A4U43_C01F7360 [Asparagus officinalis]
MSRNGSGTVFTALNLPTLFRLKSPQSLTKSQYNWYKVAIVDIKMTVANQNGEGSTAYFHLAAAASMADTYFPPFARIWDYQQENAWKGINMTCRKPCRFKNELNNHGSDNSSHESGCIHIRICEGLEEQTCCTKLENTKDQDFTTLKICSFMSKWEPLDSFWLLSSLKQQETAGSLQISATWHVTGWLFSC